MESARCRAFLAAADTGSFSRAAEALCYTPSGVSQLVTALERELQLPLLHRSKKGVTLTEAGRTMLPVIREFLSQEDLIHQMAASINGLLVGSVTIASYSSVAAHWLAGVIRDFQKQYPQVQIKLMEGIRQEICTWLNNRTADLAFLSYHDPMPYDWVPLAEDPMLVVLPPDHPAARDASYPVQACQNEALIMPALGRDEDVAALLEQYHLTPQIAFSTVETFTVMAMVEQGLGISITNELITKNWTCNVAMLPLDPPQSITLGMALPSWEQASPAVRAFGTFAVRRLTRGEGEGLVPNGKP